MLYQLGERAVTTGFIPVTLMEMSFDSTSETRGSPGR